MRCLESPRLNHQSKCEVWRALLLTLATSSSPMSSQITSCVGSKTMPGITSAGTMLRMARCPCIQQTQQMIDTYYMASRHPPFGLVLRQMAASIFGGPEEVDSSCRRMASVGKTRVKALASKAGFRRRGSMHKNIAACAPSPCKHGLLIYTAAPHIRQNLVSRQPCAQAFVRQMWRGIFQKIPPEEDVAQIQN